MTPAHTHWLLLCIILYISLSPLCHAFYQNHHAQTTNIITPTQITVLPLSPSSQHLPPPAPLNFNDSHDAPVEKDAGMTVEHVLSRSLCPPGDSMMVDRWEGRDRKRKPDTRSLTVCSV